MTDEEPQQTAWETEVGLSEETTYVSIYPSRKHAEEWMEEAEEPRLRESIEVPLRTDTRGSRCSSRGLPRIQSERVKGRRTTATSRAVTG